MGISSKRKNPQRSYIFGRFAWTAVLCVAFVTSYALAQTQPPTTKPAVESKTEPKAEPKAKPKTKPKLKPKTAGNAKDALKKRDKSGCGTSKKKRGKTGLGKDPNANWACDETTVTIPKIWQGKPLTCSFKIRNEGTADLKIRAKGG